MCHLIGPFVEFSIRQLLALKRNRSGVRGSLNLGFKQLMDTQIPGVIRMGVIPLDQQLMPFGFGQERQAGETLIWIGDDACQQCLIMPYYLDHLIDDSPGSLCNYSGMDKRDARLPGL